MARSTFSPDYEQSLRTDCCKLQQVLKNCKTPSVKNEEENLKILYKIVFLLSYRPGSKMWFITNYTVQYLCASTTLPVALVEILMESCKLDVGSYVLDILSKLIMKNSTTSEENRKLIRKLFQDPVHFKTIVESLEQVHNRFIYEKTDPKFYEIQNKLLKIINCLYIKKGSQQISLIRPSTVEFLRDHLIKYKQHKEISQNILPLLKNVCKSKQNCNLICNDEFLQALAIVAPKSNKIQTCVTLLKFLSRNTESLQVMCRSEDTFRFILTTVNVAEKTNQKKCLITILYRMTKNDAGRAIISKKYLWLMLLAFFSKTESLENVKVRITASKAYTILHRGVPKKTISITPTAIGLKFSKEISDYITEKLNQHSDESDNEESEDEEETGQRQVTTDDDSDVSESESIVDEMEFKEIEESDKCKIISDSNLDEHINRIQSLYKEFDQGLNNEKFKPEMFNHINKHKNYKAQAYPDIAMAESDLNDDFEVEQDVNYFSITEMRAKIEILKGLKQTSYPRKLVYDIENSELLSPVSSLQFESRFEGGNLRQVEQVDNNEYNLFLSPDVNMSNGLQWFYFRISGMVPNQRYVLNVVNFQKANSQFNYGLQPVMFSVEEFSRNSTGWKKVGRNLIYFGNEYTNKNTGKQFRTLSFNLTFPHENDCCYIAYHFPYTYSRLMQTLLNVTTDGLNIYSRVDILTDSIDGRNGVPLITITATSNLDQGNLSLKKRRIIFLTARVHPCESNSSWIMEGILQCLLDPQNENASKARARYIFKIIPMLNPEGVIYGNSRCGLSGNDLNRCWKKPHPVIHPEIHYAKRLVQYAKQNLSNEVFAFIDIHGHSRKKFFFLYGCNPKQSWSEDDRLSVDTADTVHDILPNVLSSINENMKLSFCRYSIEHKRETTCRVVMWREFDIKLSYTLECSFCSGENKKKITTNMLRDIGKSIVEALADVDDVYNRDITLPSEN